MDWFHRTLAGLVQFFITEEPWKSIRYFYADDIADQDDVEFPPGKKIKVTFEVVDEDEE